MPQEAITKPYANFSYYQKHYNGTLSKEEFNANYNDAEAELDMRTFHRIPKIRDADDELVRLIKFAVCNLVEVVHDHKSSRAAAVSGIASENRDGYSISYASPEKSGELYSSDIFDTCVKYLGDTGLLYRGGGPYAYKC